MPVMGKFSAGAQRVDAVVGVGRHSTVTKQIVFDAVLGTRHR